jgi:protocatechuate 3,4-dioxygenase beta subunit
MMKSPLGNRADQERLRVGVTPHALNRREALTLLGSAVAIAAGCSSDDSGGAPTGTAGGVSGSLPPTSAGAGGAGAGAIGWARGGTQALAATYPDPFSDPLGSACSITCRETLGPCYASTLVRRDVSEGYQGLPLRLVLLVVDESCSPVPDATVDIWHTRNSGTYSGDDAGLGVDGTPGGGLPVGFPASSDAGAPPTGVPFPGGPDGFPPIPEGGLSLACTGGGDPDAVSHSYFRGTQTTDDTGRVYFDTCYPGWYLGRAIHVHFIVRRAGEEFVISQLYFPEALTAEICASHPDYAARGQPDTINSNDGFYTGADHVLGSTRQPDGALLAWKTIVLRSSRSEPSCGTDGFAGQPLPGAG